MNMTGNTATLMKDKYMAALDCRWRGGGLWRRGGGGRGGCGKRRGLRKKEGVVDGVVDSRFELKKKLD